MTFTSCIPAPLKDVQELPGIPRAEWKPLSSPVWEAASVETLPPSRQETP